jgi:RNA polymerase sigma-70 factor, ECF subfamily
VIDDSTFQSLYELTRKPLWAYIFRTMGDAALADDIFQDSYIRFLQSDITTTSETAMKSYLFRIAANMMNDYFRRMRRGRNLFRESHDSSDAVHHPTDAGARYDIEQAFKKLPTRQRSLLWLSYVEDYNHAEIAAMLKVREKSVKVLLFRAKQRLLAILQELGIQPEGKS